MKELKNNKNEANDSHLNSLINKGFIYPCFAQ